MHTIGTANICVISRPTVLQAITSVEGIVADSGKTAQFSSIFNTPR
jgi:hypothetical protein